MYIRRCGGWRICVSTLARLSNARRISCGHAAINIVVCCAVLQQAAVADGHQPLLSHFSLTCALIKTSMRRNLTTAIVFDELVVKGKQAHQRHWPCHHMLCCDVNTVTFKWHRISNWQRWSQPVFHFRNSDLIVWHKAGTIRIDIRQYTQL